MVFRVAQPLRDVRQIDSNRTASMRPCRYESFARLPAFPVRAPGLVDEDLFAVNLVDVMCNYQESEECEPADRDQKGDGIPQERGEENVHGTERISHFIVPVRTSFRRRANTFLREAPIR